MGGAFNVATSTVIIRVFEDKVTVDAQGTRSIDTVSVQVQRQFLGGTAFVNFNGAARVGYISGELNRVAVTCRRQSRTEGIVLCGTKSKFVISLS